MLLAIYIDGLIFSRLDYLRNKDIYVNRTSLVYNNIYIETGTAGSDMADQSLVKNYTVAGQEDVTWTLGGSQGCHRARVRERSESPVLNAVDSLLLVKPFKCHYPIFKH